MTRAARASIPARLVVGSPLDRPVLALLLAALLGLGASVDLQQSIPSVCLVLLGIGTGYATLALTTTLRRYWGGICLLISGVVVSLAGLAGTQWATGSQSADAGVTRIA